MRKYLFTMHIYTDTIHIVQNNPQNVKHYAAINNFENVANFEVG